MCGWNLCIEDVDHDGRRLNRQSMWNNNKVVAWTHNYVGNFLLEDVVRMDDK